MRIGRHNYGGQGNRKKGNAANIAFFLLSLWATLIYYIYKEDGSPVHNQTIVERVAYAGEKLQMEDIATPHAGGYNQGYDITDSSYLTTIK